MINLISFLLFLTITIVLTSSNVDLTLLYNLPSLVALIVTPILLCTFAFGMKGLRFWRSLSLCLLNIRNLEAQEVLIAKKVISFTYGTAAFYTVMPGISILLTYDAGQAIGWSVLQSAISVLLLPSMYAIVLSEFILRPLKSKSEISAFEPLA